MTGIQIRTCQTVCSVPAVLTDTNEGAERGDGDPYSLLVLRVLLVDPLQHVDLQSSRLLVLLHILNDLQGHTGSSPATHKDRSVKRPHPAQQTDTHTGARTDTAQSPSQGNISDVHSDPVNTSTPRRAFLSKRSQ